VAVRARHRKSIPMKNAVGHHFTPM
jgi:hypothetical protein